MNDMTRYGFKLHQHIAQGLKTLNLPLLSLPLSRPMHLESWRIRLPAHCRSCPSDLIAGAGLGWRKAFKVV